jgi:hypothetical protein
MYNNQFKAESSLGLPERQREVTAAIASAHGEFDALEASIAQLLSRLEPLFNRNNSAESCGPPTPVYGSELGSRIGSLSDRIAVARSRLVQAISDIEV